MTTILTDEQVDAVYKQWLHAPGHENEHDLIRRAARAALAAQPVAQAPELYDEIKLVLENHRLTHTLEDEDGGLPLVDMLCPPDSKDISLGKEEIVHICDAIYNEVLCRSPEASKPDYAALEKEHFGDFDKRTGIYAEASNPVQAEAPKWVALPYATPSALWRAFNAGTQFVLHYHGKAHAVTHMSARENFVYVQPPGMPVKIYPDGRNCESAGDAIWLEQVAAHSPASGVVEREGWKEAAIAWEVCASLHRQWAKGKDALFTTRQTDFVKHAADARAALATQPLEQKPVAYRISDPNEPEIGHWYEDAPNGTPYLTSEPLYLGPQPEQAAQDGELLDWLLLNVSGAEFRRIGVNYAGNARREDVRAARASGKGGSE
ncbi:hypothetical protein [Hydrogenophaga laconesensis]|uniref:DUF551 domain-containing protein n=1 Tax=Hydrogenophaga laconesensis TaxID=1805971 RepID=A0ABU1V9M1_9BURK|nr:hypothetical protein [Hydrogenophaga laconesensis]MDR7094132.1 hypothetical protein [Hydrogenophaga laconesensis]